MSRYQPSFWIFVLWTGIALGKPHEWALPEASYRHTIRVLEKPSSPEFGTEIDLPNPGLARPDLADLVLLGPDGNAIPLAKVSHQLGGRMLLLAKDLQAGTEYHLYFGGGARTTPQWNPQLSLLMETRKAPPNLQFETLEQLRTAWRDSPEQPGADFVSQIYHGGNPFGPSYEFLTRYSGYLRINAEQEITFYTLSSDCSFVILDERQRFGWPGRHTPVARPDTVQKQSLLCSPGLLKVEYWAAKGDTLRGEHLDAATVLGWDRDGQFETVPAAAWMHPGKTLVQPAEHISGQTVPLPEAKVESYVAYGDRWLYELSFALRFGTADADPLWTFEDGATFRGLSGKRILTGGEAQLAKCRVEFKTSARAPATPADKAQHSGSASASSSHGKPLELSIRFHVPEKLQRTSINDPGSTRALISKILEEAPQPLSAEAMQTRLIFLCDFGTDKDLAVFAAARPRTKIEDPHQLRAQLAGITLQSQRAPNEARQTFNSLRYQLSQELRNQCAKQLAETEMDLLVFCMRSPDAFGRLRQIAFDDPFNEFAIAKVRIGDLHRLLGQYQEAVAQYESCGEQPGRKPLPVQDSVNSIAVRDLLDKGLINEAKARLRAWESRQPMTKFSSDFLLLNARALLLQGRWRDADAELESYRAVQPDSPYPIDVEFYRAWVLFESGQKDEARNLWSDLAKKHPRHPLAAEARKRSQ